MFQEWMGFHVAEKRENPSRFQEEQIWRREQSLG